MSSKYEMFKVRVTAIEQATPLIKRFTLSACDGSELPAFSGGSHVIVRMQEGEKTYSNAYSLMSDPRDRRSYQLGVRREEQSKGGSAYLHERVAVGSELTISTPNNLFALDPAAGHHVLIAGGIGITPFMSQLHDLRASGASFELHYACRSPEHTAFRDEVYDLAAGHAHFYADSLGQRLDLELLVAGLAADAHLYVCGPRPLIEGVLDTARRASIEESRVHWEQFAAAPASGAAFTVVLARSGVELEVEENGSILKAIEQANAARVECLCREGVCGTCETAILEGEAEHHDQYLSDAEKAAQKSLMICVSRARTPRLVLDL